jgi:RNA polymerase sigma-70 factor (sigma-E family)
LNRRQAAEFEAFVATSGNGLLRLAVLLTSDPYAAEEVVQETLQRLAARWDRTTSPLAFSRKVLHNLVIDRHRSAARRPAEAELSATTDRADPTSGDPHLAVELRPVLLRALDDLSVQQRAVVVLRYFDDRSESEVAALMGLSIGTVKSTASRGLARLRNHPELTALLPVTPHL